MSVNIRDLLDRVRTLRHPTTGSVWHREQSFATISPYTLEETHEVIDAILRGNWPALKMELGDLLYQVIYHAALAEEAELFDFNEIVCALAEKIAERHPEVFQPSEAPQREKKATSILDDIANTLPALQRAKKIQQRAARVGFDWSDAQLVWNKLEEELGELRTETAQSNKERIEDELGDVLFSCVNLARHLGVDAEQALLRSNAKFVRRFQFIEKEIAKTKRSIKTVGIKRMEELWQIAKKKGL